jgi:hypothetical protein
MFKGSSKGIQHKILRIWGLAHGAVCIVCHCRLTLGGALVHHSVRVSGLLRN